MKFGDLKKEDRFSWKWENSCSLAVYTKTSTRAAKTEDGKKFVVSGHRSVVKRECRMKSFKLNGMTIVEQSREYYVLLDEHDTKYVVIREKHSPFFWLAYHYNDSITYIDRDQYRNDIFERLSLKRP